ncbi:MAG: hypothetical protein JO345_16205 [Streptosporangiaceae bacterium]|nr:hypothetical protein [Streptosporangiaceae bacterium]
MTLDEISAEVERLVRALMDGAEGEVTPTASFEELGLDSLNRVDLLANAEIAFGIEVPDDEVAKLARVQDLTEFVASMQRG